MAAATRLGYHVNLAARALVSRHSGLVGVAVETLTDPLAAGIVAALEGSLRAAGYSTLLAVRTDSSDPAQGTRALLGCGAEALVFVGAAPLAAEMVLLGRTALPWVCVSDAPGAAPLAVTTGRLRGGALAAQYLLELGHRRFGVIAPAGSETRRAVAAALAERGAILVAAADTGRGTESDRARGAIRSLLDRNPLPTAIVCSGDLEALAAARECAIRRIGVPGGISIVGFGDLEFARHLSPALTTLRISAAAVGEQAGSAVIAALRGQPMPPSEVPVKLVVRETTGPPQG